MRILTYSGLAAGAALLGTWFLRRSSEYDLANRVVLITGGSRGLGLVLARECLAADALVVICARNQDELERARLDLQEHKHGGQIQMIVCDVTNRNEVNEMIREVEDRFGRIDVLVNNAGVIQVGPIDVMTIDDFEQAMNTHFWAPL